MADPVDIRTMVPRVRRAIEGVGSTPTLSDGNVKDLVADALADVVLYSGGLFGAELLVTADENGIPTEYATSEALTLPQQGVVAIQAALNFFFFRFVDAKTSERIADEAQSWEWTKSANLVRDQLKYLIEQRDKALEQVADEGAPLDAYESFLAVRDESIAAWIEPWAAGSGGSGQEDYRFGTVG